IFLSPGLQYVGGRRWLIEASVQFPIVNEPNGTQLGTDWTVSLGTRVLLF
ncbi:MAG: transporter, partial [Calditrichaeota bacterium]